MKYIASLALLSFALFPSSDGALRFGSREPNGPGQVEGTKEAACAECQKHEQYIKVDGEDCMCHATDVMRTFANDATKELTSASKYSHTTVNTGAAELASVWSWHCRPLGSSKPWIPC